ncbi:hypothetical protein B0H14DRAFT_1084226 [Mycena olivaceomarginata]|nr:hypothetical protein B0H14DRAFT_1084226 [Mycena olivaceomarginata]
MLTVAALRPRCRHSHCARAAPQRLRHARNIPAILRGPHLQYTEVPLTDLHISLPSSPGRHRRLLNPMFNVFSVLLLFAASLHRDRLRGSQTSCVQSSGSESSFINRPLQLLKTSCLFNASGPNLILSVRRRSRCKTPLTSFNHRLWISAVDST